jgi:hypothetical protein
MSGKWVYVEGFAIPAKGDLAVLHAWVTNPKNPAVAHDPTWGKGREYFGIPFQLDYVLRVQDRAGTPAFSTLGNSGGHSYAAKTR